ncbi:hypothetical protein BRADI_2g07865v3 [Brachypodium distachyon]|uniref:Uncharacterized protein n=1 Tax=Brachypodium distachyon TaxID=15368 RepID=A0A0Q3IC02_BRADI|nr:hypothetical protein BRADI_2g07865v3 [Brachypodium distachyon]
MSHQLHMNNVIIGQRHVLANQNISCKKKLPPFHKGWHTNLMIQCHIDCYLMLKPCLDESKYAANLCEKEGIWSSIVCWIHFQ